MDNSWNVEDDGFRRHKNPSKRRMQQAALEATDLAAQGAAVITQLLIERSTMDKLVDELVDAIQDPLTDSQKQAHASIDLFRKERLEV